MLLASHSILQISEICDKVIWIDKRNLREWVKLIKFVITILKMLKVMNSWLIFNLDKFNK